MADIHNEDLLAPPLGPELASGKWKVQVIDVEGNITEENISGQQVWSLQNRRVIVDFNSRGQPIRDSGGLLGTWLGSLCYDLHLLPINYTDWRLVPGHRKEQAWKVIQRKFWFDDANRRKKYVLSALGGRCKDLKQRIWKSYKRNTPQESLEARPPLVPSDQWTDFVFAQFTEKSKKQRERNKTNRDKLKILHALGRKSLARKAYEMEEETGVEPSRGELFIASRMRSDGSMVSEEARICADKVKEAMNQQLPGESDAFAQVFGLEHPGRVRCVGRGPMPSKYFSSSDAEMIKMKSQMQKLQVQNAEIVDMKSQMLKLQMQNAELIEMKSQMLKYQMQNAEIVDMKSQMLKYQMKTAETIHNFGDKLDIVASALQKVIQVKENIKIELGNIELASATRDVKAQAGTKRLNKKTISGTSSASLISAQACSISGTSTVSTNAKTGIQRLKKKSKSSVDSPKTLVM